jgi:membrane protease YdiL (CAAX protease family)
MTEPTEEVPGSASDASATDPPPSARRPLASRRTLDRAGAALDVFLCSGLPSQLFLGQVLAVAGIRPFVAGQLNSTWVFAVTLADTVVIVTLVLLLLRANGESPRAVLLGSRPILREAGLGLALVVPVLLGVALVLLGARAVLPALHNVAENPMAGLMKAPGQAAIFAVVALVGGGLREEVQRAFLLTRFEQHLGGKTVGLILTSIAFGAGHWLQGWDASVATGLLGFFWGAVYLVRRSAIGPMVSHAGFNTLEIVRFLVAGGV